MRKNQLSTYHSSPVTASAEGDSRGTVAGGNPMNARVPSAPQKQVDTLQNMTLPDNF